MKELVMTKHLEGLKKLFTEYGIREVYSFEPFMNTKEDGVVIYADVNVEVEDILMNYMDNYIDDEIHALPELRSFCLQTKEMEDGMHVIYKNGKFYE